MKKVIFISLHIVLIMSCWSGSVSDLNESIVVMKPSLNIVKQKQLNFTAGRYTNVSIAIDSMRNLTGVYEFYNSWDDQFKEFMQVNVFYFTGKVDGDTVNIKTAWPTSEQRIFGKLINERLGLRLILNEMPDGYAALDFTKYGGFVSKLSQEKKWLSIRIVKSQKARLFDYADSSHPRRGYLIQNDIVKVLGIKGNWMRIEFNNKNDTSSIYAWLNKDVLYKENIDDWK